MPELPYEIWLLIVEYLPDYHIRRLYSVNRALFNIALDLRHRDISLGILPSRVVEWSRPSILKNPFLSSRPTGLRITMSGDASRSGQNVMQTRFLSSLKRSITEEIIRLPPKPVPPEVKLAQLASVMPRLTRVTRLELGYDYEDSECSNTREIALVFSEVLRTVGNHLRSLHIESPFDMYLSQVVRLECLESFSLHIIRYYTPEYHKVVIEEVPAFLLMHNSTIRQVSFTTVDDTLDIFPIFQCLQLLSCLHSIKVSVPCDASTISVWHRILKTHRQHLRSLSFGFDFGSPVELPALFGHESFSVKLHNLRNLSIRRVPLITKRLGHLQHFAPSLVSLSTLPSLIYSSTKLRELCQVLSDLRSLQDLKLSKYYFHHLDFAIFASTLPCLRFLFVEYSYAPASTRSATWGSATLLSKWALESFDYRVHRPENNSVDLVLNQQLASNLPNVLWIRQKMRKECLPRDRTD